MRGFIKENGKEAQPVNGVIVAGNFHELLRDGVEMIGDNLRSSMGVGVSTYSSTVKLAQLTIAGK